MHHKRGRWGSKLGFILATSGAAIGLGNIQRFPYITAEGGGAIFVFIYLLCVIFLGLPLILVEFSLGRHTQKNPVCAIEKISKKKIYKGIGFLGIFTAYFILTYYSVLGGWTLGYIVKMFFRVDTDLQNFASDPISVIGYMGLFISIVMLIVMRGIKKGIERYSKIFMPILFILLIFLIFRSLTLEGSLEGIKYYLKPNFSELNPKVFLLALGQAFFSLSIGEAVLITYGSYAHKKEDLPSSAFFIAIFDTLIAILAGLIIFPALFSFEKKASQGIGLTFSVLPKLFLKMPFGNIFGGLFFLLLSFAAITTGIALLEMPVAYLIDAKKWSRKKAVWIMGTLAFFIAIPSALSKGINPYLSKLKIKGINQVGFLDIMDFIWGNLGMVFGGFALCIFVGWVWKAKNAAEELKIGSRHFVFFASFWIFLIKYFAPIIILLILLRG